MTRHSLGWTLLLFVGLTLLFWPESVAFSGADIEHFSTRMPLGLWIDRVGAWFSPFVRELLIVLIVFWNGLLLTRLVSRNLLVLERTYIPFILYLMMAYGWSFGRISLSPYVAAGLLVTSFDLMIGSFRRKVVYAKSFDSALLTGLSVLVYGPAAGYILLLPCALILFRKGWREWLTTLTGLVLPFLIASYLYWGLGGSFGQLWHEWAQEMNTRWAFPCFWQTFFGVTDAGGIMSFIEQIDPQVILMLLFWVLVIGITGVALMVFGLRARTMRTRPYKTYFYFLWILFFSLLWVMTPGGGVNDLPFLAAPLSIIMPVYFSRFGGHWLGNVGYLALLICLVLIHLLSGWSL